jgi:diguanylate cyclase (GGDEF)-like protein/PAS domain S-box-containing protein
MGPISTGMVEGRAIMEIDPVESPANLKKQLADYAMALDLMGSLSGINTEPGVIEKIIEIFSMLCCASSIVYLPVVNGRSGDIAPLSNFPSDNELLIRQLADFKEDHAWTESGLGFILRIGSKDETMGVMNIEGLAFPEYKEHYLNLALNISGILAIAVLNARNFEDLMHSKEILNKSEKQLHDITSSLGEGVYLLNEYGRLIFINPEAESLLGWTQEELHDKIIHDVVHNRKPDGSPLLLDACPLHNVIRTGERYASHDEIFIRKDGTSFPVSVIATPVIENNKVIAAVTALRDISDIKEAQDALNRANQLLELQATTDSLTGIFNRLKFDEMLIKELSRSKRYNIPLSLVMFDIDHFKDINDTFGHHMGDTVLKRLTSQISNKMRKHDYFARWGGEEFMILLTHTTLEPAVQFAEHCRVQTEEMKIGGLEGLTCSFGVTQLKADDDLFSFPKRVDAALYRAKSGGRNRVEAL